MWEEAFHPLRKRRTALLRSNGIGDKLFDQVTAEECMAQAAGGNLKPMSRGLSWEVSERENIMMEVFE
jgi:hypothetical protein